MGDMRITSEMPKSDAAKIFQIVEQIQLEPNDIVYNQSEINANTKAYIGPLFKDIFKIYPNLEHIYTSFPEGKIRKFNKIEIGGKTKADYENELKVKNIYVDDWAKQLLDSSDFEKSLVDENGKIKDKKKLDLVRLTVGDLGFSNGATTDDIYEKAEEFGLELCPPEVGPELRRSYSGTDWMLIGMKQIFGRGGDPSVFLLHCYGDQLELRAPGAEPSSRWDAGGGFVFRIRKLKS